MAIAGDIRVEMMSGRAVVYLSAYYQAERNVAAKLARLYSAELKGVNSDINSLIALTERETA